MCSTLCSERVAALERQVEEFKIKCDVITKLEEKVDNLSKMFEKYQAESKSSSMASVDLLNNKVDKMVSMNCTSFLTLPSWKLPFKVTNI